MWTIELFGLTCKELIAYCFHWKYVANYAGFTIEFLIILGNHPDQNPFNTPFTFNVYAYQSNVFLYCLGINVRFPYISFGCPFVIILTFITSVGFAIDIPIPPAIIPAYIFYNKVGLLVFFDIVPIRY